jgi:hypothetical protein
VRSEVQILPGPPVSAEPKLVVAVAATVTSEGYHESERSREGAPARCLILRGAAIAVSAIPLAPPTPIKGGGPPLIGGVAQLGERLLCKQEVIGSIPFTSTIAQLWCPDSGNAVTAKGVVPHHGWPLKRLVEVSACRRLRPATVFFDR